MPAILRQALSDRIRRLPALQDFLRDFRASTGVSVEFVGQLGHRDPDRKACALCGFLQRTPGGERLCSTTVNKLLEDSATGPARVQCDAGLWESAVPLRNGGQTFGYFLIGGYFSAPPDLEVKNKIRHLFQRVGATVDPVSLDLLCAQSPLIEPQRHAALARLLALGATHLVLEITDNLVTPSEHLPPLVQAACDLARRTFTQEVSFRLIARKLGVSTAHLSRVFHHATGLRCREYLGRLRAEYARSLVLTTDRPITDIAFAAGFQSISQFNRVFRSTHGSSPHDLRQATNKAPETIGSIRPGRLARNRLVVS